MISAVRARQISSGPQTLTLSLYHVGFLFVFTKAYMCMNVHTHLYTQLHCYVNSQYTIFVTHTRARAHTHTHTHTHRACTTCSDFGFLSRTLFLQSVCEHECTHLCAHTHTETGLVPLGVTLGSYLSYLSHTHTHTHTRTSKYLQ